MSKVETSLHLRTPDANPAFATVAHAVSLAFMPMLEINATQPRFISQAGNVVEEERRCPPTSSTPPVSAESILRKVFTGNFL